MLAVRRGGRSRRAVGATPGGRRAWWVTFGLMASLFSLWTLASPLWSVPDEASHVINAAAVVRGQAGGQDKAVDVPEFYARAGDPSLTCFATKPDQPAGCAPRIRGSDRAAEGFTQFDRYSPLPYVLLGVPSLLPPSVTAVRLMRLAGALACAALVASGLMSAASQGRGMTLAATLFAVTPMVAFLAGSVNTSGIEIAAAIALWPSLLALVRHGPGAPLRLIIRSAVAAGVLVTARPTSPLWLALVVAIVALAVGWPSVRALARDPRVVRAAVIVAGVTVVAVAWVVLRDSLEGIRGSGQSQGLKGDVLVSTGKFPSLFLEMIGVEGWLDTRPPFLLVLGWTAALGGLVLFGMAAGTRRGILAMLGTAILVYVLPLAIEVARAETSGFPWQGRYTLPLAVGVPILAGWLVDTGTDALPGLIRRAATPVILVACGAQLLAHIWSTRRYVSGSKGSLFYFVDSGWNPPLPTWLLFVGFAVVAAAVAFWTERMVVAAATTGSASDTLVLTGAAASPGNQRGRDGDDGDG